MTSHQLLTCMRNVAAAARPKHSGMTAAYTVTLLVPMPSEQVIGGFDLGGTGPSAVELGYWVTSIHWVWLCHNVREGSNSGGAGPSQHGQGRDSHRRGRRHQRCHPASAGLPAWLWR